MFAAYVVVTLLAITANAAFAALDLTRSEYVLSNMAKVNLPPSSVVPLGLLKGAGALGLLVGFAFTPIGIAAATGLVLFFIGAIVTHLRAREYSLQYPGAFLLLAAGALALALATG